MKSKRAAKKKSSSPRGFTFTISIVILAITLIAMALFSQEWRKSQRVSFTELMPSETARIEERVSSDMGAMLGADARASKTATEVSVGISSKMPFKKEGAPIAEMGDYAASLPSSLKNTGAEAVLSANEITGSTATVMKISDTGQLVYSNDGANDVLTYYHPSGWQPKQIAASITCGKEYGRVGQLAVSGGHDTGNDLQYALEYSDPSGMTGRSASAPEGGNAELAIYYPDQTQLVFKTQFSSAGEKNFTSIAYTKSPGGELILPFDANSGSAIRDYSANNHQLEIGADANAPSWQPSCKSGGCYLFTGSEYISVPELQLTETSLSFAPGTERLSNGGFEVFTGTANDNTPDTWQDWSIQNAEPDSVLFLATSDAARGFAVKIHRSGVTESGGSNYIYQTANSLQENTAYTLTFFSKGTGGSYEIYDATSNTYLQASGSWGAGEHSFATGAPSSSYGMVAKEFALPLGSGSVQLRLLSSVDEGVVYYDEVSLKNSVGMNGGFEYYYRDTGWTPVSEEG